MNFKDIYKSANDNISGDRKLIESIFEKAENKKSFFVTYYRQISVCASAVILVMTVSILPMFNSDTNKGPAVQKKVAKVDSVSEQTAAIVPKSIPDNEYSDKVIEESAEKNNEDIVYQIPKTQAKGSSLADKTPSRSLKKQENNAIIPDSNIKQTSNENKVVNTNKADDEESIVPDISEDVNHEQANETELQDMPKDASVTSVMMAKVPEEEFKDVDIASNRPSSGGGGGGGGGASKAAATSRNVKTVPLTADEYFAYLGIDINSTFTKALAGMKLSNPETIYVNKDSTGKVVEDYASFTFLDEKNPDKIILVSTSKFNEVGQNVLNDGTITRDVINGYSVTLITNGNTVNSTFKANDVWFNVNSCGINVEDFKTFISSCLK